MTTETIGTALTEATQEKASNAMLARGKGTSKVTKTEATIKAARIGEYYIKCADVCYFTAKCGELTGHGVGLVAGKAKEDGSVRKFALLPLADWLKRAGLLDITAWDKFTQSWKSERKAAEAVRDFIATLPSAHIEMGERARVALEAPEEEAHEKAIPKSGAEIIATAVGKAMTRKTEPIGAAAAFAAAVEAVRTANNNPMIEAALLKAVEAFEAETKAQAEAEAERTRAERLAKAEAALAAARAEAEAIKAEAAAE